MSQGTAIRLWKDRLNRERGRWGGGGVDAIFPDSDLAAVPLKSRLHHDLTTSYSQS